MQWKWNDFKAAFGVPIKTDAFKGAVRVVCFHGICPDGLPYINSRFLHVSKFEALLIAFKKEFHIIDLEEFIHGKFAEDRPNLLITFDDGYQNNYDCALPLLEKYQVPATLFVTAGSTLWMDLLDLAQAKKCSLTPLKDRFPELDGANYVMMKDWMIRQNKEVVAQFTAALRTIIEDLLSEDTVFHALLSDETMMEMQQHPMISIANHGGAHLSYLGLNAEEIAQDFTAGKNRLEKIGSPYGNVFAFPFGHYNERILWQLFEMGVAHQFRADGDFDQASVAQDRIVINPYISVRNQLIAICNGGY